jgi:hypothetical protein
MKTETELTIEEAFEQINELGPLDRCTNLSLIFLGQSILLLLNSGDLERFAALKVKVIELFSEADKAVETRTGRMN